MEVADCVGKYTPICVKESTFVQFLCGKVCFYPFTVYAFFVLFVNTLSRICVQNL